MGQIFTSPKTLGEVLKHEYSRETCREAVTLAASNTDYEIGTVLSKGQDGTYGRCGAEDDAAAVLIVKMEASAEAIPDAVAIVRGPAIVADKGLTWDSSLTDEQIDAKQKQLAALGIVTREAV